MLILSTCPLYILSKGAEKISFMLGQELRVGVKSTFWSPKIHNFSWGYKIVQWVELQR